MSTTWRAARSQFPYKSGMHFYDLWHGEELKPEVSGSTATLSFEVEAHGFGAVLATEGAPASGDTQKLLSEMHELARTRLATLSHEWKVLPQQLVEIAPTRRANAPPAGMVRIPEADFEFQVRRHYDRGWQRRWRGRAISVGGCAPPLPLA